MMTSKITKATSFGMSCIRVMAALGVMFGHNFRYCGLTVFREQDYFPFIQNIGVVLLFIIAGFFTAYAFDRARDGKRYGFVEFAVDKYIRLITTMLPAMLLVVAMDLVVKINRANLYSFVNAFNVQTFLGNLFFLQDIPTAEAALVTSFGSARTFWTLSVEWWIYLAAGYIALVVLPQIREKRVNALTAVGAAIICYPALCFLIGGRGNGLTFTFMGGMLIYAMHNRQKRVSSTANLVGLLLSLEVFVIGGTQIKEAYNLVFTLFCLLVVYFVAALGASIPDRADGTQPRAFKIMRFLADCTYPLYLVHYSVMEMLNRMWGSMMAPVARFWLAVVISCALAVGLTITFERKNKIIAAWIKQKAYGLLHG